MPKNISRDIITYYEQFYATIISQSDEIDKFHAQTVKAHSRRTR